MRKPRIKRSTDQYGEFWVCFGGERFGIAYGKSPIGAYYAWKLYCPLLLCGEK
jgi:hypothetical protein